MVCTFDCSCAGENYFKPVADIQDTQYESFNPQMLLYRSVQQQLDCEPCGEQCYKFFTSHSVSYFFHVFSQIQF